MARAQNLQRVSGFKVWGVWVWVLVGFRVSGLGFLVSDFGFSGDCALVYIVSKV